MTNPRSSQWPIVHRMNDKLVYLIFRIVWYTNSRGRWGAVGSVRKSYYVATLLQYKIRFESECVAVDVMADVMVDLMVVFLLVRKSCYAAALLQ